MPDDDVNLPGGLHEYERKRDFSSTPEPRGADATRSESGCLFVVQKHAASRLHYDLRLEVDGVLKSWALPKGPSLDPRQKPLAVHTEDHPIEYGDFEGIIPAGEYGGGTVMVWDIGEWEAIDDPGRGYANGDFKFRLHGEKLRGNWALVRLKGAGNESGRNWLLIKKQDEAARPVAVFNVIAELPFSVLSGRTMDQISAAPEAVWKDGGAEAIAAAATEAVETLEPGSLAGATRGASPVVLRPQLAISSPRAPAGPDWLHEVKLDGYRLVCHKTPDGVRLQTRNGHDWTHRFPAVARAAGRLPIGEAVIDGEVVVLDARGLPDFGALQNAFNDHAGSAFTYYVFDIPFADGWDLTRVPLVERKRLLASIMDRSPHAAPTIVLCEHFDGDGPIVFEQVARMGLEGIVSKRKTASYEPRRSESWMKIKHRRRHEFVVAGYTDPSGHRSGVGALILAYYDEDGELTYVGRVGSGFDERMLSALASELPKIGRPDSPLARPDMEPDHKKAHWVEPVIVAEIEFAELTSEGLLRHPVFLGLRADKKPSEVTLDPVQAGIVGEPDVDLEAGHDDEEDDQGEASTRVVAARISPKDAVIAGVRVSHPDRAVYPEARVTKQEVAEYYEAVGLYMLPHVTHRPLSLVRCPLGLAGDHFFQRHVGKGFPDAIRGVPIGSEIEGEPYLLIDDLKGLISLAQMGVLEVHTWGCREDDFEKPDQLVFDLDPGPGILWEHIVASAIFTRDYLADLGLVSFVKTTGGNGIHVVVPLQRRRDWSVATAFAREVAKDMARIAPRNFVATMAKDMRIHKIFVDFLRNTRGATAVAPYSTRARPGAHVSTPLTWDELSADRPPSAYTVRTVVPRLEGLEEDPWSGFRKIRQSLTREVLAPFDL